MAKRSPVMFTKTKNRLHTCFFTALLSATLLLPGSAFAKCHYQITESNQQYEIDGGSFDQNDLKIENGKNDCLVQVGDNVGNTTITFNGNVNIESKKANKCCQHNNFQNE